MVDFE